MKHYLLPIFCICMLMMTGCQKATPVCPTLTTTPTFLNLLPDELATPTPASGPFQVMMGKNEVKVNKVVEGPLCNDVWRGVVYVKCNVQVYPWQENPTFLKDCRLNIEPNTVVYVAYHNNAAYYNGCSCHTGETPTP